MKPVMLPRLAGISFAPALLVLLAALPGRSISYDVLPAESTLTYYMDHPMHAWSGTSHKATGTIEVGDDLEPVSVRLQAPVLSFDSANKSRDSHMAETVEFYLYPDVIFESTRIMPGNLDAEGRPTWEVEGDLTFHGVTKPIMSQVHITIGGSSLVAQGSFEIVLTDYGIKLPSLLSIKVKDWMKLEFDIHAQGDNN